MLVISFHDHDIWVLAAGGIHNSSWLHLRRPLLAWRDVGKPHLLSWDAHWPRLGHLPHRFLAGDIHMGRCHSTVLKSRHVVELLRQSFAIVSYWRDVDVKIEWGSFFVFEDLTNGAQGSMDWLVLKLSLLAWPRDSWGWLLIDHLLSKLKSRCSLCHIGARDWIRWHTRLRVLVLLSILSMIYCRWDLS